MLFSITIPVHNGERYIKEALDSALSMNTEFYSGGEELYEIVVVENGSKDRTGDICDAYAKKHEMVRVLHKGPIGAYSARQTGIRAAVGKWIITLDADDVLDPDLLKSLYPLISEADKQGSETDIIYYDAADYDDRSRILFSHPFEPERLYRGEEKKVFYNVLCAGDSINTMWTKCIRRDMAYLGREELFLNNGDDLLMTVQYLDKAKGIRYLKKTLYYYRKNTGSITVKFSDFYLKDQKTVWEMVDKVSGEWGDPNYLEQIRARKTLTCSIALSRLIYSDMLIRKKIHKYRGLKDNKFYRKYCKGELPAWAPEESVHVHALQTADNSDMAVIKAVVVYNIKMHVKRFLRLLKR